MRLRGALPLVAGVLAAALAGAASGVAKDVRVGSVVLALPPPEGFCELTRENPSDAAILRNFDTALANTIEAMAVSADCGQLEALHSGRRLALDDFAYYHIATSAVNSGFPDRGKVVKDFCADQRARDAFAGVQDTINERLEKVQKNLKLNGLNGLGVLTEDADACYFGLMEKVPAGGGTEKTLVSVSFTTVVKGKFLNHTAYSVYQGAGTVPALLAREQRNIRELLTANGG